MLKKIYSSYLLSYIVFCLLTLLIFSSCVSTKKSTYFYGSTDGKIGNDSRVPESVIQKNDILSILVTSPNKQADEAFNPQVTAGTYNQSLITNQASNTGKMVHENGVRKWYTSSLLTDFMITITASHLIAMEKPPGTVPRLNCKNPVVGRSAE